VATPLPAHTVALSVLPDVPLLCAAVEEPALDNSAATEATPPHTVALGVNAAHLLLAPLEAAPEPPAPAGPASSPHRAAASAPHPADLLLGLSVEEAAPELATFDELLGTSPPPAKAEAPPLPDALPAFPGAEAAPGPAAAADAPFLPSPVPHGAPLCKVRLAALLVPHAKVVLLALLALEAPLFVGSPHLITLVWNQVRIEFLPASDPGPVASHSMMIIRTVLIATASP